MAPDTILLVLHVAAGFTALLAAAVATLTKTLDVPHRWHALSGRVFFWGMLTVFLTAIPLAIIRPNAFLFLIGILSFYFALAGWRYATNRRGTPRRLDWASAGVMIVSSGVMMIAGGFLLARRDSNGVTLAVLGALGAGLSIADLRTLRSGGAKGPERIAQHLTMMLAGTIATVTAFVVTNFTFQPEFILWLAPTAVIAPVITVWSRKIRAGKRLRGMDAAPGESRPAVAGE